MKRYYTIISLAVVIVFCLTAVSFAERGYERFFGNNDPAKIPPGWNKGEKTGWDGLKLPPGRADDTIDAADGVVTWQDLADDGYFGMSNVAKRSYLRDLLGTVTDNDIENVGNALHTMYAGGVTDEFRAFEVTYLPNSDGTGLFAATITFYNDQNQVLGVIYMTDKTQHPAD